MKTLGWAIDQMVDGAKVRRRGWNGKDMYIGIHTVGPDDFMEHNYVFMCPADRRRIPWLCSQADLLAIDWELAE